MQVNGNYDSTLKAAAIGAGIGAAYGAKKEISAQNFILNNPNITQDSFEASNYHSFNKSEKYVEKVLENGKKDYKMVAKAAGKLGVLIGALTAATTFAINKLNEDIANKSLEK